MKKQKRYYPVRFRAETLALAAEAFAKITSVRKPDTLYQSWSITHGSEEWTFDSPEEFFAEYRRPPDSAFISQSTGGVTYRFQIVDRVRALVTVEAPSRPEIEAIFAGFDAAEGSATVADERRKRPRVFIGHGRSPAWRDLKDHLQDHHGLKTIAYESGARAGHTIRDILEEMLEESSFAALVLTAEDETNHGERRARQNVIHEVGLFQGRLGFARAVVLLEEGAEEFSNIAGIQQIRFGSGRIRETFGDVLATIRREFGSHDV
jgi:predicted nucleotide-binding protein